MVSNEQGRWTDIFLSKYGLELDWSQTSMKFQSRWWRDLCSVCGDGEEEGWFQKAIRWKVCSGDKARFWEDAWAGTDNLVNMYPRLYFLSLDQGLTVAEVGGWEESMWHWRLSWRR